LDFNYHTHTKRCRHASGEDEDYVRVAIAHGVKRMGFSDHAPFVFPDGHVSTYRVPMEEAEDYISSIRSLRERYAEIIELHVGFEMEYYPLHFDEMLRIARGLGAEYLILGQHFLYNQHPDGVPSVRASEPSHLVDYVDTVIEGMKTGVFSYLAHPDIIRYSGDGAMYRAEMKRLAEAALELNIPLEINCLGIREGRHYPCDAFWQIAGEVGAPVTVGFDSHTAESAYDGDSFAVAMELVKKYSLNYIGEPALRPIV